MAKQRKPKSAMEYIFDKYYRGNPEALATLEKERIQAKLAHTAYGLRKKAGLTQSQLAKLVKVPVSLIRSLEDSDYEKGPLELVKKIRKAIKRKKL